MKARYNPFNDDEVDLRPNRDELDRVNITGLQDEVARLRQENAIEHEANCALVCVISDLAGMLGIPDSTPNLSRETAKALAALKAEVEALRAVECQPRLLEAQP